MTDFKLIALIYLLEYGKNERKCRMNGNSLQLWKTFNVDMWKSAR